MLVPDHGVDANGTLTAPGRTRPPATSCSSRLTARTAWATLDRRPSARLTARDAYYVVNPTNGGDTFQLATRRGRRDRHHGAGTGGPRLHRHPARRDPARHAADDRHLVPQPLEREPDAGLRDAGSKGGVEALLAPFIARGFQ
jgi:hypothetical protein